MSNRKTTSLDRGDLLANVAQLYKRAAIIQQRLQHDTLLLVEVHGDISLAVAALCACVEMSVPILASPGPNGPRMLRLPDVVKRVGLGRSSIWKMVKAHTFPMPLRLAQRAVGWPSEEVDQWVQARQRDSRAG
jgi:prophage regulatory protein